MARELIQQDLVTVTGGLLEIHFEDQAAVLILLIVTAVLTEASEGIHVLGLFCGLALCRGF
jgi:hypothetical protein